MIVANTSPSTQTLTALRIRRRLSAAGAWSPWESISTGLPVAAGDSITISEADGCEEYVEVEVTGSASGATCTVEMAGR